MIYRPFGSTGVQCSIVGLGTGRLASVGSTVTEAGLDRLLGAAAETGVNVLDTADSYSQGECERLLGRALSGRREKFMLVTKVGYRFVDLPGALRAAKPVLKQVLHRLGFRQNFAPVYVRQSIEASLRRLRVDRIDVFLLHTPSTSAIACDELFGVLRDAKQAGKIGHFGVSSHDGEVLAAVAKVRDLAVVQLPLNPAQLAPVRSALPTLATVGIGLMGNQVFRSGELLSPNASRLAERVRSLASAKNVTPGRLLLQFALVQPGVSTVLTGTTQVEHLQTNVRDALDTVTLSAEEMESLFAAA